MARENLRRFLNRYSPHQLLNSLREFLENLIENARSSGNIAVQAILTVALLLLIGLLYPVSLLRRLLTNLIEVLRNLYKLLRELFLIAIQEVNLYWVRTRIEGRRLLEYLRPATQKMIAYVEYLVSNIANGEAVYQPELAIPNHELLKENTIRFVRWLGFLLLSILITVILVPTFLFGLPLLHRRLTGEFPMPRPSVEESPTDSSVDGGLQTSVEQ